MKKASIKILITFFSLLMLSTTIFAQNLNIEVKTSKEKLKVGDKVKVIVDWQEGMQAVDFSLSYDNEKLKYISSDVEDVFVNNKGNKVIVSWFSDNNTDKTKMEFKFEAIKEGQVELKTNVEGAFATGELEIPEGYTEGSKTIEISKGSGFSKYKLSIIIFIIVLLIFIIYKRNLRRKRNGKIKKS